MSKMSTLEQALKSNSGKPQADATPAKPATTEAAGPKARTKAISREGKEYVGAWLNPDFGISLRMAQLRRRRNGQGKKIYLDDLMAEALNDLFIKYDVPTVHHD